MRRLGAVAVAVTLLVAACNGDKGKDTDPTVPTAPSTSSTTTVNDVSVIPEKIDTPYLNAVLAAMDKIDGDATRIIQQTKRLPLEAVNLLNAIYSDDELQNQTNNWLESIGQDPELKGLRPSPGNRKTVVERIIAASRQCVWLAVKRDYSAVNFEPGANTTEYVALQPLDRTNDPKSVNRTAWMIIADGFRRDGSEPANPCPSA